MLLKKNGILIVYIFGSYIIRKTRANSDIGIVSETSASRDINKYIELYKIFSEIFKDRDIDIVFLNEADITLNFKNTKSEGKNIL